MEINSVLDEILLLHEKQLKENDINIASTLTEGLGLVHASKNQLRQVFLNMIANARDAMPDGGRLIIKAVKEGKQVIVTVSDNGGGMDRETIGKCFDPFYTTKPIGKGTGLGLSVARETALAHDGNIHWQRRGAMTCFTLDLPAAT